MYLSKNKPKIILVLLSSGALGIWGQQPAGPKTPKFATPLADRFSFGKAMYLKSDHAAKIPYDTISSDLQGWGRFTIVHSPEKADIIAQVTSYEGGDVSVGSKTDYNTPDGRPRQSSGTSKELSSSSVTLKIYDAKTQRELWSGSERVKSAFKKKTEEDNLVAASEKLFVRFHDYVEPPAK
jgi:hypothetical protein